MYGVRSRDNPELSLSLEWQHTYQPIATTPRKERKGNRGREHCECVCHRVEDVLERERDIQNINIMGGRMLFTSDNRVLDQ